MKVKFKQWDCVLVPRWYDNGRKALSLVGDPDREPIATASVNLFDAACPDDCMYIKDYSENEGMADALILADVIYPTVITTVPSGFVTISLYQLTTKGLKIFE